MLEDRKQRTGLRKFIFVPQIMQTLNSLGHLCVEAKILFDSHVSCCQQEDLRAERSKTAHPPLKMGPNVLSKTLNV